MSNLSCGPFANLNRRNVLQAASAAAAAAVMPRILQIPSAMAQGGSTLVVAAPATPQSLDCNFDVSLGTFEAIAALYDGLLGFEKIPDREGSDGAARRHRLSRRQAGWRQHGGQAGRELGARPERQRAVFKLRQGVKSNWGNELTAEDVRWTWNRAFELGALGAFYTAVCGLKKPEDIKVEDKYTVSFNVEEPNPLLLKIHTNLYTPVYDSVKCKAEGGARRSLGP